MTIMNDYKLKILSMPQIETTLDDCTFEVELKSGDSLTLTFAEGTDCIRRAIVAGRVSPNEAKDIIDRMEKLQRKVKVRLGDKPHKALRALYTAAYEVATAKTLDAAIVAYRATEDEISSMADGANTEITRMPGALVTVTKGGSKESYFVASA